MKQQFFKSALSVIVAAVVFSCSKTGMLSPAKPVPARLVKIVSSSSSDFVSYEYDAAQRVTKSVSQWNNGTGGINRITNVFEYNGEKLARSSNEAGYTSFTYTGNVVSKSEHFAVNGKEISTLLYQLDATGKLTNVVEQIATPENDAPKETKISYQYYSDGNVSKIDFSYRKEPTEAFSLLYSKLYVEYDDKKNPVPDFIAGSFFPGAVLSKNNPVRINTVLENGTIDGYVRNQYTYDASGYPVKKKQFIANGANEQPPVVFKYGY